LDYTNGVNFNKRIGLILHGVTKAQVDLGNVPNTDFTAAVVNTHKISSIVDKSSQD
jgi:hypothetical protein